MKLLQALRPGADDRNYSRAHRKAVQSRPVAPLTRALASDSDLAQTRNDIAEWLSQAAPHNEPRRGDIVLACAEMLNNAFEYRCGGEILLDARVLQGCILVTVTNNVEGISLACPESWTMPLSTEPRGRGLAIIKRLANSVVVTNRDHSLSISVVFAPSGTSKLTANPARPRVGAGR